MEADPSQVATYQRELKLIPLIIEIERAGLPIDVERLAEMLGEAREHVRAAVARFAEMAPGVSITSNPQMAKYLYQTLGEPGASQDARWRQPRHQRSRTPITQQHRGTRRTH